MIVTLMCRKASLAALAFLAAAPASAQQLPLGDGHVTTSPAVGNVFSCQSSFRNGARHDGPWFHGKTWNPAEKPRVAGAILWPDAAWQLTLIQGIVQVEGNGLPVGQPTGIFPITQDDSVYKYDTNPNRIGAHELDFAIPATPQAADSPGCLTMGMIGFTTTGVAIYNALDASGRDAAAHEIQDLCDGHPQGNGQYHYHNGSPCIPGIDSDSLVGWALDGYPILGMRNHDGSILTNADLDPCHGRAEENTVDGQQYTYAYRLTREYPYTLGCFTGHVPESTIRDIRRGLQSPRAGRRAIQRQD